MRRNGAAARLSQRRRAQVSPCNLPAPHTHTRAATCPCRTSPNCPLTSEMDDEDYERRRSECVSEMLDLEKQFSELKEK